MRYYAATAVPFNEVRRWWSRARGSVVVSPSLSPEKPRSDGFCTLVYRIVRAMIEGYRFPSFLNFDNSCDAKDEFHHLPLFIKSIIEFVFRSCAYIRRKTVYLFIYNIISLEFLRKCRVLDIISCQVIGIFPFCLSEMFCSRNSPFEKKRQFIYKMI